jgi:hypothetical protein
MLFSAHAPGVFAGRMSSLAGDHELSQLRDDLMPEGAIEQCERNPAERHRADPAAGGCSLVRPSAEEPWSAYTPPMEFPDSPVAGSTVAPDEDDSLVRWMLGLSPAERLQVLQGFVDSISELRRDQPAAIQRST